MIPFVDKHKVIYKKATVTKKWFSKVKGESYELIYPHINSFSVYLGMKAMKKLN